MKKLFLCLVLFFASSSLADSFQIIRDSEIENNLKAFMEPLVKAAKLNPQNINIIILADPSLNAFVTNGTDMFINSGLIIKFADDPNVLYGVMAHEIAHIYAGHLVHKRQEHENMSNVAMAGNVLGLASALAGAPDAGAFIGLGSMQSAQRGILQYSRAHETEADKIAVDLLYKTHNNQTLRNNYHFQPKQSTIHFELGCMFEWLLLELMPHYNTIDKKRPFPKLLNSLP